MVGKEIHVPFRNFAVLKKLKTICLEVLGRVPTLETATTVHLPTENAARPKQRDYLSRENVSGDRSWMSSFLPLASEIVERPMKLSHVRDRLRLHGSVPPSRMFSNRESAGEAPPVPVQPSPGPLTTYGLGRILKEIARVPSMFYRTKHEKSVREGRKIRRGLLIPTGGSTVGTLSDLYLVGENLVKSLQIPSDDHWKRSKIKSLITLVKDHPEILLFLCEIGGTKAILRALSQTKSPGLQEDCRIALAIMGHTFPVKGNGIKILALDGGGTRGVIVVEVLKAIERETGKATHELFDYIVGVSTGAILTTLLGPMRRNLDECEDLYMSLCKELFSDPGWWGTGRLFMSHSLYDTAVWEQLLIDYIGDLSFEESAADPDCPKTGIVSAVVRKGLPTTFVFRNYTIRPGYQSRFAGNVGLKYKYREAVRASSAAPGIFKEVILDNEIHVDGGTNCNNPTAVAIHECYNLWPDQPIQTVVSIGNGLWDEFVMSDLRPNARLVDARAEASSLWDKLSVFFNSATDTERVHITLKDLLPRNVYFRFNPYMSENIRLDESDPIKLEKLQEETVTYLKRNRRKLDRIVESLMQDKPNLTFPYGRNHVDPLSIRRHL
ncbi:unnamed protein product [Notodromas monacha]|uniref:PNPLA domain-containing protein n=1 Tax=Notodromas monacha TaxID=399045 RepID=A0A7R9GEG4_9CRUS|nr:unnamed protein product [Notodromas monacha]CAG0918035.1 unnamed protein product [Notodromas monacha]